MTSYDNWAKLYDEIYADRTDDIVRVLTLLKKHAPNAETLLDVACGTGIITHGLAKHYIVEGLDLSHGQIEIAKKNYPDIAFHQADMTSFNLNKKFDAILCLFNSINHLPNFEDWKKTFENIKKHLTAHGVFIFDVSTIVKFEKLSKMPGANFTEFGNNNYRIISLTKLKDNSYIWNIKVFENKGAQNYILHKDTVTELGVPIETISAALKSYFEKVTTFDKEGNSATEDSTTVYFVCS